MNTNATSCNITPSPQPRFPHPMSLGGRRVLITGASSGIGQATAILASQLGAEVVAVGRNVSSLTETMEKMSGGGHVCHSIDLREPDSVQVLFDAIKADKKPLTGFLHAAGEEFMCPLSLIRHEDIQTAFVLPIQVAVMLTQHFSKTGRHGQSGGSVVFMSSVAGRHGQAGMSIYSSARAAVEGVVKSLAVELAPKNIRVNCIVAAGVETAMHFRIIAKLSESSTERYRQRHLLGFSAAADIANVACFLLSDAARSITGSSLVADSGYSCG